MSTTQSGPSWTELRRQDMDASAELTLFDLDETDNSMHEREPDKCGTPDLFSEEGTLWASR